MINKEMKDRRGWLGGDEAGEDGQRCDRQGYDGQVDERQVDKGWEMIA